MNPNNRDGKQMNDVGFPDPVAALRLPAVALALICCAQAWSADPTAPAPAWLEVNPPPLAAAEPVYEEEAEGNGKMTITGKSRRFAIVNGQTVKPGDDFNGSRVQAIHPGKIVTEDAEKSLRLTPSVKCRVSKAPSAGKVATSRKQPNPATGERNEQ